MANEVRKITLTQLGTNAGPNFSVQYSTDCISYSPSIDCTNVFLPNVGSFAYCTVDENTTCVKLTSLSEVCNNSVIENLTLTTTTLSPTTTASPTTTVSPTTQAPTTTVSPTTTLSCYTCGDGYQYYTTSSTDFEIYPDKFVCWDSAQCGLFTYDAVERPNRFSIYDSTGLIATSGWVGQATYPGPWGSSLNTPPIGNFSYQFNSTSLRYVRVEAGPADPADPVSDFASWIMTCGTCPTTTSTTQAPTTTLSPTTTASPTTTQAPTTTTTTFACLSCDEYLIENYSQVPGDTLTYQYVDCATQTTDFGVVTYDNSGYVCSCTTPVRVSGPTSISITNNGICEGYTTTTASPTSEWTASNYDCGFGTLNDVGINGTFMGSLSGPSTFPLTSTLYGYKSNPSGINYGGTNTIQANVTTNLPGDGNCAVLRVVVNGNEPTPYETYFTTNPYPQVSGVTINSGDLVWVYVQCYPGPCPS